MNKPMLALQARFDSPFTYRGLSDASAAAALDAERFVVADDERNCLKIYRRGVADPRAFVDLSAFLGTRPGKESDLEGAAAAGQRIYWISSHGRSAKGEAQPRRRRFFATEPNAGAVLAPVGHACTTLLDELIACPHLLPYRLAEAAGREPEAPGGFNIEGLAAAADGSLLIGLRNPMPHGKALLIPLLNPAELVQGARAEFGMAVELDLDGLAVRSIDLVGLAYMIVAGPPGKDGEFSLWQWSGAPADAPLRLDHPDFHGLHPEALFAIPGTRSVQILSDDGGPAAKALPEAQQTFRSVTLTL